MQTCYAENMEKLYGMDDPAVEKYVAELFPPSDELLERIRQLALRAGLPMIQVGRHDGRHLEVLMRALAPKKIVELGTLGGYSGVCLLRGAPAPAHLYTFEFNPKHAEVALEAFRISGMDDRVSLYVGAAMDNLSKIEGDGPFDLVFIDADKGNYVNYLEWAAQHLRTGGAVLADNTFAWGYAPDPANAPENDRRSATALDRFNRKLAEDNRFRATMLPTGEGLTLAVKL